MERKKVIEALTLCMGSECPRSCPYFEADESELFCSQQLKRDARDLLIEDEKEEDDRK